MLLLQLSNKLWQPSETDPKRHYNTAPIHKSRTTSTAPQIKPDFPPCYCLYYFISKKKVDRAGYSHISSVHAPKQELCHWINFRSLIYKYMQNVFINLPFLIWMRMKLEISRSWPWLSSWFLTAVRSTIRRTTWRWSPSMFLFPSASALFFSVWWTATHCNKLVF